MGIPGKTRRSSVALACLLIVTVLAVPVLPEAPAGEGDRIYLPPPGSRVKNPPLPRDDSRFISMAYSRFFGREPSDTELSRWRSRLGDGLRRSEMILEVMDPGKSFVAELFTRLLGRMPRPGEKDDLQKALEAGYPRGDVVEAVLNSKEYRKGLRRPSP
jgi:hypothetical protein